MKNHSILWVVFLMFTVICILVYCCGGFANWNRVVAAVAITSAFLSYSDFYYIHSKHYQYFCRKTKQLIVDGNGKIEEQRKIIESILIKIEELKHAGIEVNQEEKRYIKIKDACFDAEKSIKEIEDMNRSMREKEKQYSFAATVLIVFAFLSFLCVITFDGFARILQDAQGLVSVISFAVILSSQYVNSLYTEKNKLIDNRYEGAVCAMQELHEGVYKAQKSFNNYYRCCKNNLYEDNCE